MLIIDHASSHEDHQIKKLCFEHDTEINVIPQGLTSILQPLDISINMPFKQALREKYNTYCINNPNKGIKNSRENIISFIYDVWHSESIISNDMVIRSFKCTGTCKNPNGEDNHYFNVFKMLGDQLIDKDEQGNYSNDEVDFDINEEYIINLENEFE